MSHYSRDPNIKILHSQFLKMLWFIPGKFSRCQMSFCIFFWGTHWMSHFQPHSPQKRQKTTIPKKNKKSIARRRGEEKTKNLGKPMIITLKPTASLPQKIGKNPWTSQIGEEEFQQAMFVIDIFLRSHTYIQKQPTTYCIFDGVSCVPQCWYTWLGPASALCNRSNRWWG